MERSEIFAAMVGLAVDVLAVDEAQVTEESRFNEDLDADSLDQVEFVMALEEQFDISVPEDELADVATVGQAVSLVEGKLAATATAGSARGS